MNEFPRPEQLNNNQRSKAERVSSVIHALTDRHYVPPSQSFQADVPDTREGFDENGNFHRVMPHRENGVVDPSHPGYEVTVYQPQNRWGSMGEYIADL